MIFCKIRLQLFERERPLSATTVVHRDKWACHVMVSDGEASATSGKSSEVYVAAPYAIAMEPMRGGQTRTGFSAEDIELGRVGLMGPLPDTGWYITEVPDFEIGRYEWTWDVFYDGSDE